MKNPAGCGKMETNQRPVSLIKCPVCGFLLAKAEPTTRVTDLLLYCRRCRMQVRLNLNNTSEP